MLWSFMLGCGFGAGLVFLSLVARELLSEWLIKRRVRYDNQEKVLAFTALVDTLQHRAVVQGQKGMRQ
jgi:hypothetical protein